jgi:hypothetical protein
MSDGGGGIGVVGVLVGALIVVVVGGGIFFAPGTIGGSNSSTVTLELPKVSTKERFRRAKELRGAMKFH